MVYTSEKLRALVHHRANHACEYYRLPNTLSFYPHVVWVSTERLSQLLDESGHLTGSPECSG